MITRIKLLAVFTTIITLTASGGALARSAVCDRACLSGRLDAYLNAVITHNPDAAPLLHGYRHTENARVIPHGQGIWRSATGLGEMQRRYFDPVTGQAAYFGIIEETGGSAIVTVRLRVEDSGISEAEWYIGREGDPGMFDEGENGEPGTNIFDLDNLIADPPPVRVVPYADRLPRETLIAITNSYFDGITSHDGSIIMAHPGCMRTENGFRTTGRPIPEDWADEGYQGRTDCTSGMGSFGISLVAGRRFLLVDEEAQVVLATAVFLRNPGSLRRRNCFSEWFFIDDGRIREIYAAMFYPPDDQPVPNWPPYDGNFPLPGSLNTE